MSLFSGFFILFFLFSIVFIWVKKPPLPIGSGKNTKRIRYESDSSAWKKLASLYSLVIAAFVVFDLFRMYFH